MLIVCARSKFVCMPSRPRLPRIRHPSDYSIPLGCFVATVTDSFISSQKDFVSDGTCDESCRYSNGFRSREYTARNIKTNSGTNATQYTFNPYIANVIYLDFFFFFF